MKKTVLLLASALLFISCTDEDKDDLASKETSSVVARRNCASDDVLKFELANNPKLALKMQEIEEHAINFENFQGRLENGQIIIPVVVNVIYKLLQKIFQTHKFNLRLMS